jgi:hypothetical protein
MGGSAYSARCVTATEDTLAFFRDVLGFEIRRDVEFTVGERTALLKPEGTTERFLQAFAPASATGYLVLMDHQAATKPSPAPNYGPPNRGIGIWSFATKNIDDVHKRHVPDFEALPRNEGALHMTNDPKSILFRNGLLFRPTPSTSSTSSTTLSGVSSESSLHKRSSGKVDTEGVVRLVDRIAKNHDHYPNIKGQEYDLNFGQVAAI